MLIDKDGHKYFIIENIPCVGFTFRSIPGEERVWLNGVLEDQFKEVYARGYKDAAKDIKESLKPLKEILK